MKIESKEITVRELVKDYADKGDDGVVGYGGKLDIRPPYQREFIYKDKQRDAVIDTVTKGFPLNVMYWAVRTDGNFEMIDGQQRTLSICQYVEGDFAIKDIYFHNLPKDKQEQILDYKLTVFQCSGTDSDKLEWFRIINTAGERLNEQELRNAVYHGPWLTDAKRYFSKTGCVAWNTGKDHLTGSPIRQEFLETAIDWLNDGEIEAYMADHQSSPNASELWLYFQAVINWVKATFPHYRKEMKGVAWGKLYNKYKNDPIDFAKLEIEIKKLMADDDVSNKKGIYLYVLGEKESNLNIRAFTSTQKRGAWERQGGVCSKCGKPFDMDDMEADHIDPWSKGGKTTAENCQVLCRPCNRRKGGV